MPPVQDHKRAFEGDSGPNTGGMGSYSTGLTLPFVDISDVKTAEEILQHVIDAMKKEDAEFKGVLYGQFMVTKDGLKIIEFNSRFGDPEAMNVLSVIQSSFIDTLQSISDGKLGQTAFFQKATVVKYLVPEGYPGKSVKDSQLEIDERGIWDSGAKIYYASVYEKHNKIYTSSSRAIAVAAVDNDIAIAEQKAEEATKYIKGPVWHRKDIGTKALLQKRVDHMKRLRG
jgi:phosphoribosylamine--glycine ligase